MGDILGRYSSYCPFYFDMIKAWLRHYFGFTAKESKGFLALCVLLVVIFTIPALYRILRPETEPIEFTIQELKADSLLEVMEVSSNLSKVVAVKPFLFDPNIVEESELMQMGMPAFLARRIVKYRSKGGKFKVKGDLRRIYGMPETLFVQLKDYIQLPDSTERKGHYAARPESTQSKRVYKAFSIDMNTADTLDWQKIDGIGNTLSKRIIKFRDKLGGFARKEQLFEVYGLDSVVVKTNWEKFELTTPCKKIPINLASEEELAGHSYVGRKLAKVIVNYRKQHGEYKKAEDMLSIGMLDKEKWEKIVDYLQF